MCRARAVNAFAAVERQEMGLAVGDRVLVVRQELLPGAGWIFATRGDASGYVPRNYLTEEVVSVSEAVLVKTHNLTIESDAHLTLGPLDWQNRGRAIPCTWFFPAVLPPQKLIDALRDTLRAFPHFAARYTRRAVRVRAFSVAVCSTASMPTQGRERSRARRLRKRRGPAKYDALRGGLRPHDQQNNVQTHRARGLRPLEGWDGS